MLSRHTHPNDTTTATTSSPFLPSTVSIERATSDLRKGIPVRIILENGQELLVAAAEEISEHSLNLLDTFSNSTIKQLIAAPRSMHLWHSPSVTAVALPSPISPHETIAFIRLLAGVDAPISNTENHMTDLYHLPTEPADKHWEIALLLLKQAELLPSAIVTTAKTPDAPYTETLGYALQSVTVADIQQYRKTIAGDLHPVCEAPLVLKEAEHARIIAFRPSTGGQEHYAIIIGEPEKDSTPLIRVHSSCYTGDLLGSLACDCGDQLQAAIHFMGEHNPEREKYAIHGGIILYLLQEGRGIGLTNKLHSYALQSQGFDTVDANEILGFEDDERHFYPASVMLKHLGVKKVRLLTNNPRKAEGLSRYDIHVTECVPHVMQHHKHNFQYLKTKSTRLGHLLDIQDE